MTTRVTVPQLGESVVEATVGEWMKQEGDNVNVGDVLVSLETDKVDVDVGAETAGVLARIERQAGEDVQIGDVLAVIEEGDGATAEPAGAVPETPTAREAEAARQEPIGAAKLTAAPPETAATPDATPVARRMAAREEVDLARLSGSGPGGRVTKGDVQSYLAGDAAPAVEGRAVEATPVREPVQATRPEAPPAAEAPPAQPAADRETRERMSRRRRTIARRLVEAQQTAAMLTTFNEVDMSRVIEIRKRRRDSFQEQHGVKLGFMSFFVKAVIGALKQFPPLNAEIQEDEIILKHYYDIGMAVGAEEGLVVPVIRDADRMSFAEIERIIGAFVEKVRENTLSLADLRGGTFTITNGGVFGSLLSTPILNPPQVGILGLHKIEQRPVAVDGEVVIRPMMYVALSYDHRIVDGREAVQFLVKVKELIEDPETLLLEG
ncbi:MAG: 2-oxoglutarate dehydrogenase complex dihydrolipoyllysine-residue succinyltransferase [Candidatus Promineifilaceae bacterium]|nr:2-oxoglutarate dehydrogenase complex dihydrolipoyllysine-residue succinyltransferase [Candidatus Promineifilaceae bacterium]